MSDLSSTDNKLSGFTGRDTLECMIRAGTGNMSDHLDRRGGNVKGKGLHPFVHGKIVLP